MKSFESQWPNGITCRATFSDDDRHRYLLERVGDRKPFAPVPLFVMLNPSSATHEQSDPTVTRCAGFAKSLGSESFAVVNLFSLRSTDPKLLLVDPAPEGDPENSYAILQAARRADILVLAWGVHGGIRHRAEAIIGALLRAGFGHKLRCLGRTISGHPKHPLYLRADTVLENFWPIVGGTVGA